MTDTQLERATTASIAPLRSTAIVSPAVQTTQAVEAHREYQNLCTQLLDESDYQQIGQKQFRKKSGWRKLAVAFNVSNKITSREYERDERGRIVRAEVIDQATAPNGRTCDGLGACDLFEKCCVKATCRINSQWHTHCDQMDGGCDGTRHFSNPQHDIPATAATRARNRACADLFGAGEVSAEEIANPDRGDYEGRTRAGEEHDQRTWFEQNGWDDENEHNERRTHLRDLITAMPEEMQKVFGTWRREQKIGSIAHGAPASTLAEVEAMEAKVVELVSPAAGDQLVQPGTEQDTTEAAAEPAQGLVQTTPEDPCPFCGSHPCECMPAPAEEKPVEDVSVKAQEGVEGGDPF